jgi:hypothetical protein
LRILGQHVPTEQSDHHAAAVEERDVIAGHLEAAFEAQILIEAHGAREIGDAERDDVEARLFHCLTRFAPRSHFRTTRVAAGA